MSRMPWTGPRIVLPVALAAAAVAAVSGRRTWLTGQTADAVLGSATIRAAGADVVPGLVAIALVLGAGVLAAATAGPLARRIALIAAASAGVLLSVLSLRAVTSAAGLLGTLAAERTSRTGSIPVQDIAVSPWPWLVAAAAALATVAVLGGLAGAGRWRGLSQRYDAPSTPALPTSGDGSAAGSRGERTPVAWDDMDKDIDPTAH